MHIDKHIYGKAKTPVACSGSVRAWLRRALLVGAALAEVGAASPRIDFEVFEKSIPELQSALESGAITSRRLVELYSARIEAYDRQGPALNAIAVLNPKALAAAEALDEERRTRGPRGPLHGIPILVKDNYETVEMPTAAGSIALAGFHPKSDAFMVRRLKQEMKNWDNSPMFPCRKLEAITVDYPQVERQVHAALKRYTELRTKGVDDTVEKYATEFVLKLLKKRLFSSPQAFLTTLTQHQESLRTARRRQASSLTTKPTEEILRRQLEQVEEEFADDEAYEAATDESIGNTSRLFRNLTPEEQGLLDEMLDWAEAASRQPDAKATQLLNWINETIRPNGQWSNERVIILSLIHI